MKLALAVLLLAAPLVAQTPSDQKIVVNVVVTLVKTGAPPTTTPTPPVTPGNPTPAPPVTAPPVVVPPAPPAPPVTTPPAPPTTTPPGTCISYYANAVKSMNDVSTDLLQAQQLYASALASGTISNTTYASGIQTLSVVRLDSSDVRDLIRIAAPSATVVQNINFVSAEIGTLPGILGSTTQLGTSLTSLNASMQTSLATASNLVTTSTCPLAVPF